MIKMLFIVVSVVSLVQANLYQEAEEWYARAKYDKAAIDYERFYLKNPTADLAISSLFKSAQSYYFSRKLVPKNEKRSYEILDKILILQEPEDPYYYKAILFKTHMHIEKNEFEKAQQLYSSSSIYATREDRPQSNVICYELYRALGDTAKSNYCLKKIKRSNGMAAVYTGTEADIKKIVERPQLPVKAKKKVVSESGQFSIQVGAFSLKQNAEGVKNAYSDLGRSVLVKESKRESGVLFLVWVGKFESKEGAQSFAKAHIADKEPTFRVVTAN